MIEKNDLFDYGYYIYQNSDYFKFSLDSILLAEFVKFKENDEILDMCTGNAPIPMILTAKNNKLNIDAVEIQSEIYDLAQKSIETNKLSNITLYNTDIKEFNINKKYDIITCNPPYFKVGNNSLLNENKIKQIARHEVKLKLEDIIDIATKQIKETGSFYLVHRCDRLIDTIHLLEKVPLGIRRICIIYTKDNSNGEFFLLEATKNKKDDAKITYKNIKDLKSYKNIFGGE